MIASLLLGIDEDLPAAERREHAERIADTIIRLRGAMRQTAGRQAERTRLLTDLHDAEAHAGR
jgi:hypothetical protein